MAAIIRISESENLQQLSAVMENIAIAPICALLRNRFQSWRGITRLEIGIVRENRS